AVYFDFYHAEQIQGRINVDRKKVEFLDLAAKSYGGEMKGQIWLDRGAIPSYIIWTEFLHWQPEKLQEFNPSIFSQMYGGLNGTFRMKNGGESIQFFTAEFSLPKGGEISAPFIRKIASEPASL